MNEYYKNLKKPSWSPQEQVFGQVWSVLYVIIIAVNAYVIWQFARGSISWKVALPFWLNLFFNLIFTPIQFGLKNNLLASVDIMLVLATIIWAMVAIWPVKKYISLVFVPYLLWVIIATVLQVQIYLLNR